MAAKRKMWERYNAEIDRVVKILEEHFGTKLNFTGITIDEDDVIGEEVEGIINNDITVIGFIEFRDDMIITFHGRYKIYGYNGEEKNINFELIIDNGKIEGPYFNF